MTLKLTENDFREVEKVAEIIKEVEHSNIPELVNSFEEIESYQPFLISLLLGYKDQLDKIELDELANTLIIIWRFYQNYPKTMEVSITADLYQNFDEKNIRFLNYLTGEPNEEAKLKTIALDLDSLKSKALLTGLFYRYNENKNLSSMEKGLKGEVLLGLKSLIQCFDSINQR